MADSLKCLSKFPVHPNITCSLCTLFKDQTFIVKQKLRATCTELYYSLVFLSVLSGIDGLLRLYFTISALSGAT